MAAKSLHDLKQTMQKQPQVMVNVPLFDAFDLKDYAHIEEYIQNHKNKLGSRGRILVRPSGTERCLRVMAEGESLSEINQVVSDIAKYVTEAIAIVQ